MKIVAIVSGGMDSTTMLYDLIEEYDVSDVHALTFDYGQRHKKEIDCATKTCKKLGVHHKVVDLSALNELSPSALTRNKRGVPEGYYKSENMKQTVVPLRNTVMLSLAASYAIGINAPDITAPLVYYAAHAGDHDIYPDCRSTYIDAMNAMLKTADWNKAHIRAPYLYLDKGDIVNIGMGLGVDYANTWTCYNGREKACGKCGACTERLEAFKANGIKDPLEYE